MKTITVTITQRLELPDDCQIVKAPSGEFYLFPQIQYWQTKNYSDKEMKFEALEEDTMDLLYASLAYDKAVITAD